MLFDVIVCGGGVQGLWTAKYLAEQKQKVLLLEQFPFPHTRGSSHGQSRATRYSYTTPHHSRMMPEAYKRWEELETSQNKKLFVNCGLLSFGSEDFVSGIEKSLDSINISYESFKSHEIPQKFVGMFAGGFRGVFEGTAGVLKANHCLLALQKSFLSLGGVMHDGEKVELVSPVNSREVKVITHRATYQAKSVVLTCGAWINQILKPLNLRLPVKPKKVVAVYWQAKYPHLFTAQNGFPVTSILQDNDFHVYSTPILEYPGLMKVCCHGGVEFEADEPGCLQTEDMEKQQELLRKAVETFYPNLKPVPAVKEYCIYTDTPDKDFILDRHPVHRNIIIGAGFSGHGFKLSPTVGKILGDLVLCKEPVYDMDKFSLRRFRLEKSKL